MVSKEKRPGELSPGRNSSMIKGYVKGARNVNRKCESESLFLMMLICVKSLENCADDKGRKTATEYAASLPRYPA
jgi:uncharacterized protein (DUF983 family)